MEPWENFTCKDCCHIKQYIEDNPDICKLRGIKVSCNDVACEQLDPKLSIQMELKLYQLEARVAKLEAGDKHDL